MVVDRSAVEVPDDFEREFPGSSRSATEVTANLVRTANALVSQIERPSKEGAGLSVSAFQTLAILDGAGEPLPGHVIAQQLLVSSASMTSLLDTLERRGLIERRPHPSDRRKVLVHLTADAQVIVDERLPGIHAVITRAIHGVSEADRKRLLDVFAVIRANLDVLATQPLPASKTRQKRRAANRLT